MKTLKESLLSDNEIKESLLSDIDTTLARGEHDVILSRLFSTNLQQRRETLDDLRLMVESYHPKRHLTTAKMKNSDSYFIEFTRPINIEDSLSRDICDWISCITICKRTGLSYNVVCIHASKDRFGDKIYAYKFDWRIVRPYFNPKASNSRLYEVPEELNGLFERIQTEAYKHRST
jgi:hypothetical protein